MNGLQRKSLRERMMLEVLGRSIDDIADVAGDMLMVTLKNMDKDSGVADQIRYARFVIDNIVTGIRENKHIKSNE